MAEYGIRVVAGSRPLMLCGATGRLEEVFAPEQIAVYVHLPFCRSFCAYCTFNKVRDTRLQQCYLEALLAEMAWYAERPALAGVEVSSVYFGGGTPSSLPAEWIVRIQEQLRQGFAVRPLAPETPPPL